LIASDVEDLGELPGQAARASRRWRESRYFSGFPANLFFVILPDALPLLQAPPF